MAERLVRPSLRDILDAIEHIDSAMAGKTEEALARDWMLRYAVQRAIEIISEASRRIPERLTARRPEIPWREVKAIGNILRHEYDHIADRVIHDLIRADLAPLKAAIIAIEGSLDEPEE